MTHTACFYTVLLTMAMPNPSQPSLPDYYDVLGIDFNATSEQVRRAYFHKARQVHPDKESGTNVEDWHLLNKAYTTLTDSIQRQDYSEHLAESADTDRVPDLTHPALPSSESLSKVFKSCYEHWVHLRELTGIGSFNKAFVAELVKLLKGRCKQLVRQGNKGPVPHKRKIVAECNYESVMKSIAEAVNMPASSPVVQEVTENLLRIIRAARMNKTSSNVTGSNVPVLDLSTLPVKDLWLLMHLFAQTHDTCPPSNASKNDIQMRLMEYIPFTDIQEDMLKREVEWKCGECISEFSSLSRPRYSCASCGRNFCKRCPIPSMKAPCIGINAPKPICQECTMRLKQNDAEDWTAKALQLMKSRIAGSQRAAMACVLMALHSAEVIPLQHLRRIAKELIEQGFQEQALVILSVLQVQEEADSNENIRVSLSA